VEDPRESETKRERGVLLEVAYDGTAFHGWAAQNGATSVRTVEETLRGAIHAIDARASGPRGASRTDAGVHARGQLAAFDATLDIPPRGWVLGLNQHLPDDVAVRAARIVSASFTPRFAALGKRYRYRLHLDKVRDPAWRTSAWRVGDDVDLDRLVRETSTIVGTHDFAAFRSSADERAVTVRTMTRAVVEVATGEGEGARPKGGDRIVSIVIDGTAFLHNMVRILVGTVVDVARGRLDEGAIVRAIASKDRRVAGTTAPAHGLTLERVDVELPKETGDRWPQ
jgi:tRNA pseudouridine38-40 synthase